MIDHDRVHGSLTRLKLQAELLHRLKDLRSCRVRCNPRAPSARLASGTATKPTESAAKPATREACGATL
jgi:hypothetical protein